MRKINKINKRIDKILNNGYFLLLCSFLLAISFWFWISTEESPIESITISNVPVSIDYSDSKAESLGLQFFGDSSYFVDVTVTGKRFVINELTANDLVATASAKAVNSPGTKILPIEVKPKNKRVNYEVSSISKNSIDVLFDVVTTKEFTLIKDVILSNNVLPTGYRIGEVTLSNQTIGVSGPASKLEKISDIKAIINVNKQITTSSDLGVELKIETEKEEDLQYLTFEKTSNEITANVTLLKEVKLPLVINFTNLPEGIVKENIRTKISPSELTILVKAEDADNIKDIEIGNIDYQALKKGANSFKFNKDSIDHVVVDNIEYIYVTIHK